MNPLKTATGTIISGLIIAVIIALVTELSLPGESSIRDAITIWTHVASGITWIGLLYYFNFVQVQGLAAAASDEGGPGGAAITKYVAPRALLWFRWAALVTWLSVPLAIPLLRRIRSASSGDEFNALLADTARLHGVFGLLWAAGIAF